MSFAGSDTIPMTVTSGGSTINGDPTVAFDQAGELYYAYMEFPSGGGNLFLTSTLDQGATWSPRTLVSYGLGGSPDKPHMLIDANEESSDLGAIYISYTWTTTNAIWLSFSSNGGQSFQNIPLDGSGGHASNMCIDRTGTVYCIWADNYVQNGGFGQVSFARISDGGATVTGPSTIQTNAKGLSHPLKPWAFASNGWPTIAVDTSRGQFDGRLYAVWAACATGPFGGGNYIDYNPDIFISASDNEGVSWSTPMRVNDDPTNTNLDQWFPWLNVDPDGGVNILFYDSRADANDEFAEVWMARSNDGGASFVNFPVSSVRFKPCNSRGKVSGWRSRDNPPPGCALDGAYIGDYITIASDGSNLYPCWCDNRVRRADAGTTLPLWQAFAARVPILDTLTGTLANDMTLVDNIYLAGDVHVPAGKTLTILGNARITAAVNASISVSGKLRILSKSHRPIFRGTSGQPGSWDGIKITFGGQVDWGPGCVIKGANVGVTVDAGADSCEVRGVTVDTPLTAGFQIYNYDSHVRLVHDTVRKVSSGYGVYVFQCDPRIDSSAFLDCQYGIYAVGSSLKLRGDSINSSLLTGIPYGIYVLTDPEFVGLDTAVIVGCDVIGYYTSAHLYAGSSAHCVIDSSAFVTYSIAGGQSPYGIRAYSNAYVHLRRSKIRTYLNTGFQSTASKADLGTGSSQGNNSIYSCLSGCYDLTHTGSVQLKAEYCFWGESPPTGSSFSGNVDYSPYLSSDPLPKWSAWTLLDEHVDSAVWSERGVRLQSFPNPFNSSTVLQLSLPSVERVKITIHNILGQVVRELVDREFTMGIHEIMWDGRNHIGNEVASGVYLCRVNTQSASVTAKLTLIR